jgi:hypothetical protein
LGNKGLGKARPFLDRIVIEAVSSPGSELFSFVPAEELPPAWEAIGKIAFFSFSCIGCFSVLPCGRKKKAIRQIVPIVAAGAAGASATTLAPIPYEELAPESQKLYEVISPLKLGVLQLAKIGSTLEKEGNKLRAVQHPFKFLEGNYIHPELRAIVREIFATDGITTGMKRDGFIGGVQWGMEKYLRLGQIECYIEPFSARVHVPAPELRALIQQQDWERLVRRIFVQEG